MEISSTVLLVVAGISTMFSIVIVWLRTILVERESVRRDADIMKSVDDVRRSVERMNLGGRTR